MAKLKVLTMTVLAIPEGKFLYKVYNTDGEVIASRVSCRSCLGTTFIAALVTKNLKGPRAYTIKYLATNFKNLKTKSGVSYMRPYGIAVVEERKEEFKAWAANRATQNQTEEQKNK
jgi:hypothetical protein